MGFRKCRLFGVSSLGSTPDEDYRLTNKLRPHRVLDPMLWLLHEAGVLP